MVPRCAVPQRLILLALLLLPPALFVGCGMGPMQGPPDTSAPQAPPAPPPPPPIQGLAITTPADGATVTSPMKIEVQANLPTPIDHARVMVDGNAVYYGFVPFNTLIWMNPAPHTVDVIATDAKGGETKSTVKVNVQSQVAGIDGIQNLPYWNFCTAVFPPGHPRAGQVCASGLGNATSTLTQKEQTPSQSGSSAQFSIGGPTGYSNALWWYSLGGGGEVSHFAYDMWLYIDHPELSQALEFDLNQGINGTRWIWGTECNFKADKLWDIWNGATRQWVPTTIPCNQFPANEWVHLIWTFERANGMARYVSVQINDQITPVNIDMPPQPNWNMEDIDVAFQLDGDWAQQPYNVWIDNFTLRAQ